MKKILLTTNVEGPDKNALDFASYLCRLTKSKLTGVFLENVLAKDNGHEHKKVLVENSISLFKDACITREVGFSVHRDRALPVGEIVKESRFADLVVTAPGISFNSHAAGYPSEFVKEILKASECPVIIAPENFTSIDEIIFTYDRSASSVFAIKQFTYLFPELCGKKTTIIQVNKTGQWTDPDKYKFNEWLKDHFKDLHFEARKAADDTGLFECLFQRKNAFIVMGAYGGNTLLQFFKKSHADLLIKTTSQPIFITHLK